MENFFKALRPIIENWPYNEGFGLQNLVDKGGATVVTDWQNRDHASTGRGFYFKSKDGGFDTKDYKIVPLDDKKNPQLYKKMPVDKPIYLDGFSSDINSPLSEVLKILTLAGKTLAIVPINNGVRGNVI